MVENLGPLGSNNSSRMLLTVPKRAVGAVGFRLITIGSGSFTAITQLIISATLEILLLEQPGLCQYVLGFAKVA